MMNLNTAGWLVLRLAMAYVYLYALYQNTHDKAARNWLLEHTAYMFAHIEEPLRGKLAKWSAIAGMMTMFVGSVSILLGVRGRAGGLLLLLFTAGGIYQHLREREVAMEVANRVGPLVSDAGKPDFTTLQWSAYSGHFSSGLKNWALCGICFAFFAWGTGPYSLDMWLH